MRSGACVACTATLQARYQRHDSPMSRLVSNVSSMALQRRLHRTANDPVYLAAELQRWCLCKSADTMAFFKRRLQPLSDTGGLHGEQRAHMQVCLTQ